MTRPNCHLPGEISLITHVNTQRQMLMHNARDGVVKNALAFVIAWIAGRTHQVVHAACIMSNHYHLVATDRTAERSKFTQHFHHFATKIINKLRKRRESIWTSGAPNYLLLTDTDTVVEKMLYTWLNPVKAGLVDRVDEWDHFMILPRHWGKTLEFDRPDFFTGASGTPKTIKITAMPPKCFQHLNLQDVIAYFERRIKEEEENMLAQRKRPAIGMERIYKTSPFSTPKTAQKMYTRNPRFSGKCKKRLSKVIAWWKRFQKRYRIAFNELRTSREALFPPGTIKLVQMFGLPSELAVPDHPNYPRYARFSL